jgi:hypothetical protein
MCERPLTCITVYQAAIIACDALNERMQVVAQDMDNPTWSKCYKTFYGRILRIFVISWSVC